MNLIQTMIFLFKPNKMYCGLKVNEFNRWDVKTKKELYFLHVHNSQKSDRVKEDMESLNFVKWPTEWPQHLHATHNPGTHWIKLFIYLFVWLYINNINHGILVISRVFMFSGGDHLQQMTVGTQNFVDHRLLACEHATSQVSASLGRHTWYCKWVHVPLSVSWRCLWQATDSKCFTTHSNDWISSWIDLQYCFPSQQTLLEILTFCSEALISTRSSV